MRRYQVNGYVTSKGISRPMRDVFITATEEIARRLYCSDHSVVRIDSVTDVTDAETGWTHVAFVRSDSDPDRWHEVRRNEKSGVIACGCKEYRFSRGTKTCHHLVAFAMAGTNAALEMGRQVTVSVRRKADDAPQAFTVVRRSISVGALTMQSISQQRAQRKEARDVESMTRAFGDPFGLDDDREAFLLLDLIDAEFRSDPMSVQCFDLRIVERVKQCVARRKNAERCGKVPPLLTEGR
jgi:hypothetical protein